MKTCLLLLWCLLVTCSHAIAQDFKPFKVGIGFGYAAPAMTGAGAGGGFLFFVEPAYRPTNNVLIGLRLETAIIARGIKGVGDDDVSGNASANASYTLNTQYYFNENYVRPFVGAGLGFFSLAAVEFNTALDNSVDNNEVATETRFGFYPRIGADIGHFNLTLDYNFIPKTNIPGIGEVKNNYLGIRVGFSIGGGVGEKRRS